MAQSSDGLTLEINYILSVCSRQIGQRLNYIRKLSVQRFSSREERHTAVGPDRQGPIAIKFDFFCGVPRYVALRIRGQLGRRTEPRPRNLSLVGAALTNRATHKTSHSWYTWYTATKMRRNGFRNGGKCFRIRVTSTVGV